MSDSFRYGSKKEINFEQFVQKLKNVQETSNADLWKLFGVFDRDNNGKIESQNTSGELEAKSLFDFLKSYAGDNNVLDDDEIQQILSDPQITSNLNNTNNIAEALAEFFNSFKNEEKQDNNKQIIKHDNFVEIITPNETITVSKLEEDGTFLAENFIKKVYKNENNEEVTITKDESGFIKETVIKSNNDLITTFFNTSSVYIYDNFKDEQTLQMAQVLIRNGEEYFAIYDGKGNTQTHPANNDGPFSLRDKFGFNKKNKTDLEHFYQLNPHLKGKNSIRIDDKVFVPGHYNVTDSQIINQGSIANETRKFVKYYNEKLQREFKEKLENFRNDNFSGFNKEAFEELSKVKGFEISDENAQMYFKISLLPPDIQNMLVADIQAKVNRGLSPDEIKEDYLNNQMFSIDGENMTYLNLFDGPTIELPAFSNPGTMRVGNNWANCNTELLFFESGGQTKNFSVKTFFTKILGLDITQGEGKTLYQQFCNVNDPLILMDINAMFANITRRTSGTYKEMYNKAKNELTESYKETYLGQGIASALDSNKPLSVNEAKKMFIAVIKSLTAPKGQVVRTNYDSFINDHKDFYLRKFATEMVALLYNRNGTIAQQAADSKSILNPIGKGILSFMAPRYNNDAQTIYPIMSSDCYLGNKKIESTIKGYDTKYKGYNVAKVKRCWEVMQNPNASEEQKIKAMEDAFGYGIVHIAENLSGVCNFADNVTDIILLMYGTGLIGKGLTKAISFIPKAGATISSTEALITGAKGITWGQRLTSLGISSATFSIYDSARFAVDYFSGDMYSSQGISFGEGLGSSAAHAAAFGAFASFWGQAVTGNVLKWLFKTPQAEEVSAEAMRLMTKQFKNSSKMSGKQILSAYNGANAKAMSSIGKEFASFGSEVIGFSTFEIIQKWQSGQLKDADLTEILSGQFKTLLSFKAVGNLLFMHKAGKLPQDTIKLDSSKDVSIKPIKKGGKTEYKITYPDGKTETVPDMQTVVALCNKHYENVAIFEPIEKVLNSEKKIDLDNGISISKDENGYSVIFPNGEQVSSKNLREVFGKAQAKFQLIQYDETIKKDGSINIPNGQNISLDRQTKEYITTTEYGTKVYADNLEELLHKTAETELCENIENSLKLNEGKFFLNENTLISIKDDNSFELKIVLNNGKVIVLDAISIEEAINKAKSVNVVTQIINETTQNTPTTTKQTTRTQKPPMGITDNADVSDVVQRSADKSYQTKISEYKTTPEGLIQLIQDINTDINTKNSNGVNGGRLLGDFYSEADINKFLELFDKDSDFVMNLLKEQLMAANRSYSDNLSPAQVENLIKLKTEHPDAFSNMPIRDKRGKLRIDSGLEYPSSHLAESFIRAYEKNPELTMQLVNSRYKFGNDMFLRFNFNELEEVVNNIDSNPRLKDAVNAKVITTDGTEKYAYSYKQIKYGLLDEFANPKEVALMKLKTPDGKYQLFSEEDIEMLLRRDIDNLVTNLNKPKFANEAIKELQFILADSKMNRATNKGIPALYDIVTSRFILENIPDDAYAVDIGELYVDGTYEVRALTKNGVQTTRFRYDSDNYAHVDLISSEDVISQNRYSTIVRTKFADGKVIIDVFEKAEFEKDGDMRSYVKSQKRTVYDKDGEPIYEETITPSKNVEGELDIITADRVNGRVTTAETKMFGKTTPLIQSKKTVKSGNHVTTETTTIQEDGCHKSFYVIRDANNKVILSQERQHLQMNDEGTKFISIVKREVETPAQNTEGKKVTIGYSYEISFESDKITVKKEGQEGEEAETVTIDTSLIDPSMMNLFKQLPGDFLFALAKSGVTAVKISKSPENKNGAFYDPDTKSITLSEELMDNPFVFAHELGHAIDELMLGNLSKDEELSKIFNKELETYRNKKHISDAEGRIIDYFSTNIHYSGNKLVEVVAEVNALLSGLRNSDSLLLMRGLKLMQNFPETIKYISDRIMPVLEGEVKPSEQKSQSGTRLGISEEGANPQENITTEKVVADAKNAKYPGGGPLFW